MKERSWKIFATLFIIISVISAFISWKITLGYILGSAEAVLQYKRTENFWNGVMDIGSSAPSTGYGHFVVNYGIMALTLFICAMMKDYFNIIACAFGMLMVKVTIVTEELLDRGGMV